jgi:hypothetical protein
MTLTKTLTPTLTPIFPRADVVTDFSLKVPGVSIIKNYAEEHHDPNGWK